MEEKVKVAFSLLEKLVTTKENLPLTDRFTILQQENEKIKAENVQLKQKLQEMQQCDCSKTKKRKRLEKKTEENEEIVLTRRRKRRSVGLFLQANKNENVPVEINYESNAQKLEKKFKVKEINVKTHENNLEILQNSEKMQESNEEMQIVRESCKSMQVTTADSTISNERLHEKHKETSKCFISMQEKCHGGILSVVADERSEKMDGIHVQEAEHEHNSRELVTVRKETVNLLFVEKMLQRSHTISGQLFQSLLTDSLVSSGDNESLEGWMVFLKQMDEACISSIEVNFLYLLSLLAFVEFLSKDSKSNNAIKITKKKRRQSIRQLAKRKKVSFCAFDCSSLLTYNEADEKGTVQRITENLINALCKISTLSLLLKNHFTYNREKSEYIEQFFEKLQSFIDSSNRLSNSCAQICAKYMQNQLSRLFVCTSQKLPFRERFSSILCREIRSFFRLVFNLPPPSPTVQTTVIKLPKILTPLIQIKVNTGSLLFNDDNVAALLNQALEMFYVSERKFKHQTINERREKLLVEWNFISSKLFLYELFSWPNLFKDMQERGHDWGKIAHYATIIQQFELQEEQHFVLLKDIPSFLSSTKQEASILKKRFRSIRSEFGEVFKKLETNKRKTKTALASFLKELIRYPKLTPLKQS